MQLKLMLLLAVVLAFAMCGRVLSGPAERRYKTLCELQRALRTLHIQVCCMLEPLQDALRQADFPLFLSVSDRLSAHESVMDVWRQVKRSECRRGKAADCLSEMDMNILDRLFSRLGSSGIEGQGDAIMGCISSVEAMLDEAKIRAAETGRLYTSLGFLAGLGAAILLI